MEIFNIESSATSLSSSYEGDEDVMFLSRLDSSEDGLTFFREKYLDSIIDRKINNYSSLYLTNKRLLTDCLYIKQISDLDINTFNTSLVDNNSGLYLTLCSTSAETAGYYFTEKNQKFIEHYDRIFEIKLLNEYQALIFHRSRYRDYYYLKYNNGILNFVKKNDTLADNNLIFNYVLDTDNNKLSLFKDISCIYMDNNSLLLKTNSNTFKDNYFNINFYIQKIYPKLNTSWASYNPNHKNVYDVNPIRSRSNLKNNYLISTQYSYITGNELKTNILTLKNQNSNKNYKYRLNFLENIKKDSPSVDNRFYTGLFTGNEQEKGNYSITLGYEFYNNDYRFKSDTYNPFISPENLYPYEQISINDLKWDESGAIAGETPYMSDRIYQKLISSNEAGTEYLCSWLFKNKKGEFIWLDRFYYPLKTSYAAALSTSFNYSFADPNVALFTEPLSSSEYYDVPFSYNSLEEEYAVTPQNIKSAVYGRSFYDKMSDLVIKPDTEYIYFRIGNTYVKDILKSIQNNLIQNGLNLKNSNNSTLYNYISANVDADDIEYVLDNDSYSVIENYNKINETHQFTISFYYKSNDWSIKNGYQILGNLNQIGFSLYEDRKITPLIMLQHENKIYTYNTDFILLDNASLKNEENISSTKIKELYRIDHLDSFYTINIQ